MAPFKISITIHVISYWSIIKYHDIQINIPKMKNHFNFAKKKRCIKYNST